MKDLVSIIVPVHNSEKYLKGCIDSLLNQDYKNIEIIAVENASTDNSLAILKEYGDKIKTIILKEAGIGLARNIGLKEAKGKYISFVDSDDNVRFDFISKMLYLINKESSDLCICDILEKHVAKRTQNSSKEYPSQFLDRKEILSNLDKFNYGPCNKLYKSEIIKNNNICFEEKLKYEDFPFVLSYLINIDKVSKVNEELYIYNIHNESEQTTVDKRIFDILKIVNKCSKLINKEAILNLKVKTLTNYAAKTRYIKSAKIRNVFIDEVYKELNRNKRWKKCDYLKSVSLVKRVIYQNKSLMKLYSLLYSKIN